MRTNSWLGSLKHLNGMKPLSSVLLLMKYKESHILNNKVLDYTCQAQGKLGRSLAYCLCKFIDPLHLNHTFIFVTGGVWK